MTASLEELQAKEAIRDAVLRITRGVDRADIELIRSAYHRDAREEHGSFTGDAWDWAEKIVETKRDSTEFMSHFVSNILIELRDERTAWVESYYLSIQGGARRLTAGGRYIDRFEEREGDWKIAHRLVVLDFAEIDGERFDPADRGFPSGRLDRSDPSYR
jgi:hypothetical protein